jgi:hypothetical protein
MACNICSAAETKVSPDIPHVLRVCQHCGGKYRARDPGPHGLGVDIKQGDEFVLPSSFMKVAANPLKGGGRLTPHGLSWFAELVFGTDLMGNESRNDVAGAFDRIRIENEKLFETADFLADLNLNDPSNEQEMIDRLSKHEKSAEWWGYVAAVFSHMAGEAVRSGDAAKAAWAAACAERVRALAIFKIHFEEVVYMGHSAGRLIDLMKVWDSNRDNSDEGFWQTILGDHAYAFSQLFSVPVTFIEGTAYVGGTQLDGKNGRYLDFMLSGGSANHAILVEIKTPVSSLLGAKYRGNVYPPSKEVGGAVVQITDYCDVLRGNVVQLTRERGLELNTFNPRRIVLIGDYDKQLVDAKRRSSFELFRSSLAGVEIVTFDEFFKKIEHLAKLFNLVRPAELAKRDVNSAAK